MASLRKSEPVNPPPITQDCSTNPLDTIQLPTTRTEIRIQGVLSETTKAEASATRTKNITMMPNNPSVPALSFNATALKKS